MAKKAKDGETNRSQAIRDLYTQNPAIAVRDVISTLALQGVDVKPGLVYLVKGKMKGRRGRRRKVRRQAEQVMTNATVSSVDALATIRKVKSLAAEVGGLKKLMALVEALSE